jgi:PKHD-type hydroxylase
MYIFNPAPQFHHQEISWWNDGFSTEELDSLEKQCDALPIDNAKIMGEDEVEDPTILRKSKVAWIHPWNSEFTWLFDRLAYMIQDMNSRYFGYDLKGIAEGIQYTVYNEQGDHYDWHVDSKARENIPTRKLSLSLLLSDPSSFEGGDLEIWNSGGRMIAERKRGHITAFPSYSLHKVHPVTSGVRKSLVCWVSGPQFK